MSQTNHLTQRNGIYYFRRRVPLPLVENVGAKIIQFSLHTADLKEAKKRRDVENLKTTLRFEAISNAGQPDAVAHSKVDPSAQTAPLAQGEIIRLVQDYVERSDQCWRERMIDDPPDSRQQEAEIREDVDVELGIVQNRDDPRADETVFATGKKILQTADLSIDDPTLPYAAFAECVRRGLVELQRRKLSFLDHQPMPSFDRAFSGPPECSITFAQLAHQALQIATDDATIKRTSAKWIDKQRTSFVLLREIIGDDTLVSDVDYDTCLKVRGVLARVPAGRTRAYGGVSLAEAMARAETDKRPGLSPTTQEIYLGTLRSALDLAAKKRLIATNPAAGLKPLKRDAVQASAKRLPLTTVQLKALFQGRFYRECEQNDPPYQHDKDGWRFWLPLVCLFMGLRPNEVCQMRAADVKCTEHGTWYLDIVASTDGDDRAGPQKVLKTETSTRRVPVHPELLAIGFVEFVKGRLQTSPDAHLFGGLRPDRYGNYAKYPLKRFREQYLPKDMNLQARQSFYSLRHNFRDALRRIDAPPDALQSLGGWSQGRLVSDDYGDKSDPDYQKRFLNKVAFPGLSLEHLHVVQGQIARLPSF